MTDIPWYFFPIIGLIDFAVAFLATKFYIWLNDRKLKRSLALKGTGLSIDISYQLEDAEVFGIHLRGKDMNDLIDNIMRGFSAFVSDKSVQIDKLLNRGKEMLTPEQKEAIIKFVEDELMVKK